MDDLISRQAAINALERKKDKNAKGDIGGFYNKIIQNDIDALMQLPSAQSDVPDTNVEDTISRQAAIYVASGYCHPANIAKELAKLPSAQPEITRCKDCKKYDAHGHRCKYWNHGIAITDYCSYGELHD